jgi:hypothetical protein
MVPASIAHRRLYQQRLSQHPAATPQEVVSWLGAVQAQEYPGAQWSLGLRMREATGTMIDHALEDGTILRTHVMRPTWHFVAPADIRWLLELTASRVNTASASIYRQCELDDALFARCNTVIAKALEGGRQCTRAELGAALADAGIEAQGTRLACIMMRAELDAIVCSGAMRGKQLTYALLDERVPQARRLERDEAVGELTLRYFISHGPATIRDFAWWSGLKVADVKAGLTMVSSQLAQEVVDGTTYWFSASTPSSVEASSEAYLLPTFDEFLVGYDAFDIARRAGRDAGNSPMFQAPLVIGGQVAGSWKRTLKKGSVVVDVAPFAPLDAAGAESVAAVARRLGDFIGLPVEYTSVQ